MIHTRFIALATALTLSSPLPIAAETELPNHGAGACPIVTMVENGAPLDGGGTLAVGVASQGVINRQKEVVFIGRVADDDRNQGVFVVGPDGLKEIARGCGSSGGQGNGGSCGDPTPIGGTYGGLFDLNDLEPRINDSGDVVFFADVSNGSSQRGLFLYRAVDQTIVKVVALGDPSPLGGTIEAFGNGIINERGQVAFYAWDTGTDPFDDSYLALWDDGVIEKVVMPGDPLPSGGEVEVVVFQTVGLPDGTFFAFSPTASFDELGRLAVSVVGTTDGILLFEEGASSWLVREGDPVPGGGAFGIVGAPMLRNGRTVFGSADPGGLFIGTPGNWQSVWREGQTLEGDSVESIVFTRGRHIVDDTGQVTALLDVRDEENQLERRMARWNEVDGLFTILRPGGPAPGGGVIAGFSEDTSVNRAGDVTFNLWVNRSGAFHSGVYRIDDCLVGEIFADGFESGNTFRWSSTSN